MKENRERISVRYLDQLSATSTLRSPHIIPYTLAYTDQMSYIGTFFIIITYYSIKDVSKFSKKQQQRSNNLIHFSSSSFW
jgi:hypothetical protein